MTPATAIKIEPNFEAAGQIKVTLFVAAEQAERALSNFFVKGCAHDYDGEPESKHAWVNGFFDSLLCGVIVNYDGQKFCLEALVEAEREGDEAFDYTLPPASELSLRQRLDIARAFRELLA